MHSRLGSRIDRIEKTLARTRKPTVPGECPALLPGRPARRHGSGARPQREPRRDDRAGHGDQCPGAAREVVAAGGHWIASDIRG